jgi:cell division protein FtsL
MARIAIVLAALLVILIVIVGFLSITIKHKNSDLKALKSEIEAKDEKINSIRADLQTLKDEMEKGQKAGQIHVETTIKAGSEYVDKINTIESDKTACDWLDQPLPDAVMRIYSDRVCEDTNDKTAVISNDPL